jgi:hypothetical protein
VKIDDRDAQQTESVTNWLSKVTPRFSSACTWGMYGTKFNDRSSVSTNTMFGRCPGRVSGPPWRITLAGLAGSLASFGVLEPENVPVSTSTMIAISPTVSAAATGARYLRRPSFIASRRHRNVESSCVLESPAAERYRQPWTPSPPSPSRSSAAWPPENTSR